MMRIHNLAGMQRMIWPRSVGEQQLVQGAEEDAVDLAQAWTNRNRYKNCLDAQLYLANFIEIRVVSRMAETIEENN